MAKQIEGVYEKLFACATREFLEKGYKDASLREIAREAEPAPAPSTPALAIRRDCLRPLWSLWHRS